MRHNIEDLQSSGYVHIPVLWREILEYVETSGFAGKGCLVDNTLGEGGHTELLLKTFGDLKIIAFERDQEILSIAKQRLSAFEDRVTFINDNFSEASKYFEEEKFELNYFLYDFGISSYHIDKSSRGFVFKEDEPLDMRLDKKGRLDAHYIVNHYDERKLADVIFLYGEERWSRRIASVICTERKRQYINTTGELARLVLGAIPKKFHVKNIHPATRVFQALRIEVNNELRSIEKALNFAYKYLVTGGRIMAISFHSLEDRLVKNRFRRLSQGCTCEFDPKYCQCAQKSIVKILTGKPIVPGEDEIRSNNRSRSAKLRVCEKL